MVRIVQSAAPVPPKATPRKAVRVVTPNKPPVVMAPPKPRFQKDGVKPSPKR